MKDVGDVLSKTLMCLFVMRVAHSATTVDVTTSDQWQNNRQVCF